MTPSSVGLRLIAAAVLLVGCGTDPSAVPLTGPDTESSTTASSTTASSTTASSTSTTTAPLVAGPVIGWDGAVVTTLCVASTQSYPQVPGYRFAIETVAADLLAPTSIAVTSTPPCDATLDIRMSLEGRAADYEGFGTVYSGMLRRFDTSLTAADRAPLEYHHLTDLEPSDLASSLEPTDPSSFVVYYESVWPTILLEALVQYFGPAVAIELLRSEEYATAATAQLCVTAFGGPDACEPTDYDGWRAWFATR